ncbi:MAG: DUF3343 domain-containing protein [Clostridia bacterium]|nr:DUF3343 domain-containing protein [Clostridia bacterium]MDE7191406.1 DUF3343 domain-containing protein [Clostridia bacterium]MDE7348555.1 DUF3343 domain-containing protein [Clostridia bacterium]
MIYTLIIFRSRNDALAMRSYLSSRGVISATVNAPRSLTQSCGLALRIQGVSTQALVGLIKSCPAKVRCSVYQAYMGQGGIRYSLIL